MRSWRGPSRCFALLTLWELDCTAGVAVEAPGVASSGGVVLPGGVVAIAEGIDGASLASEFLRGGVDGGCDTGVMARGPWLALRENGNREEEAEEGMVVVRRALFYYLFSH